MRTVHRIDLPITPYTQALRLQHRLVRHKLAHHGPDFLLLLEHPPTVTLGSRSSPADLLIPDAQFAHRGIELVRTDRGGAATYHGPGQLVGYPLINLRAPRLSVREYVGKLETVIIATLNRFGIAGRRKLKEPGVWTSEIDKIASIGVRITNGVTMHGFSINVNLDRDPSDFVTACGLPNVRMTGMADLIDVLPGDYALRAVLTRSFAQIFDAEVIHKTLDDLPDISSNEDE